MLATTKETMWVSSTVIIVGSSIVEDGLEMQRDVVDNFKQCQALSFSYPYTLQFTTFYTPKIHDYVKGFILVRSNGELYTIPGFLPITCTFRFGFVYVFSKETE